MKSDNRKSSINWVMVWLFTLSFVLYSQISYADEYRYQYFSLENAQFPPGFNYFNQNTLGEDGAVYGALFHESGTFSYFAVYKNGVVTIIPGVEPDSFLAFDVNKKGLIGGLYITDIVSFTTEAALIDKDNLIKIPGDFVCDLNDAGVALVVDGLGFAVVKKGIASPINLGFIEPVNVGTRCGLNFNNRETLIGTTTDPSGSYRGFRLTKRSSQPVLLPPLASETDSWALDINNKGKILGYSFIPNGTERVGLWQTNGVFKTYFTEGTAEFPTISNHLVFNDKNIIVITNVVSPASEQGNSYLIPKPGVRLNLADITENIPDGQDLCFIDSINNHGDITGFSCGGDEFLLKRIDE